MPPVSLEYKYFAAAGDLMFYNELLAEHMRQLVTLNILNWPTEFTTGGGNVHMNPPPYYHAFLLDTLNRLATDIFLAHRRKDVREQGTVKCEVWSCSLESVVFGVRERGDGCLPPQYFVLDKHTVLGKVRLRAANAGLSEMVNAGLDVGILNHEKREWRLEFRKLFTGYEKLDDEHDFNDVVRW